MKPPNSNGSSYPQKDYPLAAVNEDKPAYQPGFEKTSFSKISKKNFKFLFPF